MGWEEARILEVAGWREANGFAGQMEWAGAIPGNRIKPAQRCLPFGQTLAEAQGETIQYGGGRLHRRPVGGHRAKELLEASAEPKAVVALRQMRLDSFPRFWSEFSIRVFA